MKKLLTLLLALSLVMGLTACVPGGPDAPTEAPTEAPTAPPAISNGIESDHKHCLCVGTTTNAAHTACTADDGWLPVGTAAELTAAFDDAVEAPAWIYLTADITIDGVLTVRPGAQINVCLNGKTLLGATRNYAGVLNITDCCATPGTYTSASEFTIRTYTKGVTSLYAGNITITDAKSDTQVMGLEGNDKIEYELEEDKAIFNLYGGKIYNPNVTSKNGANFYMGLRAILNIYGGEIGESHTVIDAEKSNNATDLGGSIVVWGRYAQLNMYGGKISGGEIKSTKHAGAMGGNIGFYRGTMKITGGTITDGFATNTGGNISILVTNEALESVDTVEVLIENCTISNGECGGRGGNIYFNAADNPALTATVRNSTISGGKAGKSAGNIMFNKGTFTLESCKIKDGVTTDEGDGICGGIAMQDSGVSLTLKGANEFANNAGCDLQLRLRVAKPTSTLSIAGITGSNVIKVSPTIVVPYTFTNDTVANASAIFQAVDGYAITEADGKLTINYAS